MPEIGPSVVRQGVAVGRGVTTGPEWVFGESSTAAAGPVLRPQGRGCRLRGTRRAAPASPVPPLAIELVHHADLARKRALEHVHRAPRSMTTGEAFEGRRREPGRGGGFASRPGPRSGVSRTVRAPLRPRPPPRVPGRALERAHGLVRPRSRSSSSPRGPSMPARRPENRRPLEPSRASAPPRASTASAPSNANTCPSATMASASCSSSSAACSTASSRGTLQPIHMVPCSRSTRSSKARMSSAVARGASAVARSPEAPIVNCSGSASRAVAISSARAGIREAGARGASLTCGQLEPGAHSRRVHGQDEARRVSRRPADHEAHVG